MQVETLNLASKTDPKVHLRVAAVTNENSSLSFLYIGADKDCIKALSVGFRTGLIAENFVQAKALILSEDLTACPVDAIIIDLPFNEEEVRDFREFLTETNKISFTTPLIYNTSGVKNIDSSIFINLVDDVIDVANWSYDFSSKISFLQNMKAHSAPNTAVSLEPSRNFFKRAFDIIISSILILAALPIMGLIALVIRLESRGPIFYNAKRAGRGFRIFRFYKFRTMVVNADAKIDALGHLNQYQDSNGPKFFKIANDPRVTRVGKFLRNSSLDELPQLFNVLKGDMSLVGNRPLPLYEASTLTTNEFVERFMAPAGITGLWQIKKRGQSNMSTEERISLDIAYARKSNMLYDLWIMANTPKALLQKSDV